MIEHWVWLVSHWVIQTNKTIYYVVINKKADLIHVILLQERIVLQNEHWVWLVSHWVIQGTTKQSSEESGRVRRLNISLYVY